MEIIKVKTMTETEIVFTTAKDLIKFYNELENGKQVVIEYRIENPGRIYSQLIRPNIFTSINDGKIMLKSEELVK